MSEFKEYFKNNFRVEENGELSAIRKDCYNGNNLGELVLEYHLEKMWDYQQSKYERAVKRVTEYQDRYHGALERIKEADEVIEMAYKNIKQTRESGDAGFYDECEDEKELRQYLQKYKEGSNDGI